MTYFGKVPQTVRAVNAGSRVFLRRVSVDEGRTPAKNSAPMPGGRAATALVAAVNGVGK
jgi:hypothetical protein